jgi:hypothetical protein
LEIDAKQEIQLAYHRREEVTDMETIKQYIEDVKTNPNAWENWEFRAKGDRDYQWEPLNTDPKWLDFMEYRRRPAHSYDDLRKAHQDPSKKVEIMGYFCCSDDDWVEVGNPIFDDWESSPEDIYRIVDREKLMEKAYKCVLKDTFGDYYISDVSYTRHCIDSFLRTTPQFVCVIEESEEEVWYGDYL